MRHTVQLRLAAKLLRTLTNLAQDDRQTVSNEEVLSLLAIVQLAAVGIMPDSLIDSPEGQSLKSVFRHRTPRLDSSRFANAMTKICRRKSTIGHNHRLLCALRDNVFDSLWQDPCLLGWIYQLQNKDASATTRIDGEVSGNDIGLATQWFTPKWIARFLTEQAIDNHANGSEGGLAEQQAFLDPACGAGHILIEALTRLATSTQSPRENSRKISQSAAAPNDIEGRVHRVLESQIFGLDVDPFMIELCGFALYLEARRLCPNVVELPVPALYCWRTANGANDAIGSLRLITAEATADAAFYSPLSSETRTPSAVLPRAFAAISANPPYLSHRIMPEPISRFLKTHYPTAQYDLYAAFLRMSVQLLDNRAKLAMICQQSFLSIQRYTGLRNELLELCQIEAVAQLGPGSFAVKAGEKVNNAVVVLRKNDATKQQSTRIPILSDKSIRCWRLLSNKEKEYAEEHGMEASPWQQVTASSAHALLDTIGNAPLSLWCPPEVARLFRDCAPLESEESGFICSNGLFTCDNKRFVKTHDQIEAGEIEQYVPYDKGGGYKWYRTTPYLLHWKKAGEEIRQFRKSRGQSAALPGEKYYFRNGVTYSYIGTRGFKARLLSPGSIFDIASSAIFSENDDDEYLVGFLNSSLVCFLLGVLNPTINFQIGDLRRLPYVKPDAQLKAKVIRLSRRAIEIAQEIEQYDPNSPRYKMPLFAGRDEREWPAQFAEYSLQMHCLNNEEAEIQREINLLIFQLYDLPESTQKLIAGDPWVIRSHTPICKLRTYKQHTNDSRLFSMAIR